MELNAVYILSKKNIYRFMNLLYKILMNVVLLVNNN